MQSTPIKHLEKDLKALNDSKDSWTQVSLPERIEILQDCMDRLLKVSEAWAHRSCQAKEIPWSSSLSAEEWLNGPLIVMRHLRLLRNTLEQIHLLGQPYVSNRDIQSKNGQIITKVFPKNIQDRLLYAGFEAEVWMEPEVTRLNFWKNIARIYRPDYKPTGKVALVLGAGNGASIPPSDLLHKLFVEDQVCILKMNPVNEYIGPFLEKVFRRLIQKTFLRIVYGGTEQGQYLVEHPDVDEVHMTGSDKVHDIIVWGAPGKEQERNKRKNIPKLKKPMTSELGCVTPVIVVPGNWSEKELQFQAENVATMVVNNASFNCNAAKMVLTWQDWPQRNKFLQKIEKVLSQLPPRKAYYPGSNKKYQSFCQAHPKAKVVGKTGAGVIPWTTIFGVDSKKSQDIVFKEEAWCGLLAESPLPAKNVSDYLKKVSQFCNQELWGTLSCSMIVHPQTQKQFASEVEQAISKLEYGTVAINHWPAINYGLLYTSWGAYPGHTLDNIVSGIGTVHNTMLFDKPQKSVLYGPFTAFPKPPWFATHKNAHRVAPKLVEFEYKPSWVKLINVAVSAMRG